MRALIVFTTMDENPAVNQELFRFSEELHHLDISSIAILPSRLGHGDQRVQFAKRKICMGQFRGWLSQLFVAFTAVLQRVDFIACADADFANGLRRLTSCPVIDVSSHRQGTTLEERVSAAAVIINQVVVWRLETKK